MVSSMIYSIITPSDFYSRAVFENYLGENRLTLATNQEVPPELLLKLSTPDWSKARPQGSILLITSETKPQGVVSKYIACMCFPFCFIREDVMPKGTIIWVNDPDCMAD